MSVWLQSVCLCVCESVCVSILNLARQHPGRDEIGGDD